MWLEMRQIFTQLSEDPAVRAIALSGSGEKAFSTGLDVQATSEDGILSYNSSLDSARKAAHLDVVLLSCKTVSVLWSVVRSPSLLPCTVFVSG